MTGIMIAVLALALHLICCAALLLLWRAGLLKASGAWMLIAFFLPFWGELGAAACHIYRTGGRDGRRTYADEPGTENDVYRNVAVSREEEHGVIPLEEALRINDSAVKRTMIMDILNEQPEEYVGLLKEARSNEDVEVVHYATTAMSELSKEYDLQLQSMEAEYAARPDDGEVLDRYAQFLEDYLGKGLAQGRFLTMQRVQYGRLLKRQIERGEKLDFYLKAVENALELKNYAEASGLLDIMEKKWPDQESVLLERIRCYAEQGGGNEIRRLIGEIERRGIYLTSEGKRIVEFWSKGGMGL